MAKMNYNMLVRDNYPNILERTGKKKCNITTVNEADFLDKLSDKLEETIESFLAEYHDEHDEKAINFLADIADVMDNIVHEFGLTDEAFLRIKEARHAMYGSFDKRILLESIEDVD